MCESVHLFVSFVDLDIVSNALTLSDILPAQSQQRGGGKRVGQKRRLGGEGRKLLFLTEMEPM